MVGDLRRERQQRSALSAILALVALFLTGCSKPASEPAKTEATAPAPARATSSTSSAVVGKVVQPSGTVVVMLEPKTETTFPPQTERPVMDQVGLTFGPDFLFVRTGEPVDFKNDDDTLHNVHVTHEETHEPQFNVAIPTGSSYPFTFKRDGFYRVGCDIHPSMSATIFASSTPYVALADAGGGFEFDGVAPGRYLVTIYSGGKRSQKDVEVKDPVTNVTIE
jgi:plastocyanin